MIEQLIQDYQKRIHRHLEEALQKKETLSAHLKKAMLYSVLNGGKRLRPILVYITGTTLGAPLTALDNAAGALELIHCYSLIHDDLPAMDNATYRRGQLTCHKVFGEATAILAGDGLLPLAFEMLTTPQENTTTNAQVSMVNFLAEACGITGMVDGQALDMSLDGSNPCSLETLYWKKTGKLIHASVMLATIIANKTTPDENKYLDQFAHDIGLAFQIVDDLLDMEGGPKTTGKDQGLDIQNEKNTYPYVFGVDISKQRVKALTESALRNLSLIKQPTDQLKLLAEHLLSRTR